MMTMMLMMAWFVSFGWLFDLILVVVVMAGALLVLTVMIVMAMMVSVMLCHCAMDQDYCREYAQDTTGNLDALPFCEKHISQSLNCKREVLPLVFGS